MAERSLAVFAKAQESAEKFDYFICGVTGALFAFLGERYIPRKIEFASSAVEPIALLFLLLAFIAGLKRIHYCNVISGINHDMLDAGEKAGHLTEVLAKTSGSSPYYNLENGEVVDRQTIEERRRSYIERQRVIRVDWQ